MGQRKVLTVHKFSVLSCMTATRAVMLVNKMTYFVDFGYLSSSCIRKSIISKFCVPREINSPFCSKTYRQMFLLVSGRHANPISINLGKTFFSTYPTCRRRISVTWILARVFAYLPSFFFQILYLSVQWFWFLFWSILNAVTLKTSNTLSDFKFMRIAG